MSASDDRSSRTSLEGTVALVTGANTGIGCVTARELLRFGADVYVACRSHSRTLGALEHMKRETGRTASFLELDLGDLASVRRCARAFGATGRSLHLLINNAGVAGERGLSASGFELAFGVNHVGHFLLTQLLLPQLRAADKARVVTVASRAHVRVDGVDWEALRRSTRSFTGIREYAVSKLANVLFSAELARRVAGTNITTYALHPGVITTDIWRHVPWPLRSLVALRPGVISPEEGALTTLYCATDPALEQESGFYYSDRKRVEPSRVAQDLTLAAELWERSAEWTSGDASAAPELGASPQERAPASLPMDRLR